VTTQRVRDATSNHLLIGEVGLDRATALEPQQAAFDAVLDACTDQPVLLSIHSTGRTREVLAALTRRPHAGAILHWFNGTTDEVRHAVDLGCYFSVNAAMTDERISRIPHDRLLPETDFPSSRRSTRASRPGDIDHLEQRLAALTGQSSHDIRSLWYHNLSDLVHSANVEDRLPSRIRQLIDTMP